MVELASEFSFLSRMVGEFALIATAIKAPAPKQVIHSPDYLQRSEEPLQFLIAHFEPLGPRPNSSLTLKLWRVSRRPERMRNKRGGNQKGKQQQCRPSQEDPESQSKSRHDFQESPCEHCEGNDGRRHVPLYHLPCRDGLIEDSKAVE
jgi:hypothetical protein